MRALLPSNTVQPARVSGVYSYSPSSRPTCGTAVQWYNKTVSRQHGMPRGRYVVSDQAHGIAQQRP